MVITLFESVPAFFHWTARHHLVRVGQSRIALFDSLHTALIASSLTSYHILSRIALQVSLKTARNPSILVSLSRIALSVSVRTTLTRFKSARITRFELACRVSRILSPLALRLSLDSSGTAPLCTELRAITRLE